MKKNFTHLGRVMALALLGTCVAVHVQAQESSKVTISTLELPQDFLDTINAKNLDFSRVKLLMDSSPDFPNSYLLHHVAHWRTYKFNRNIIPLMSPTKFQVDVAGKDSVNIYYQMVSDHIFVVDGCQKVAVKDISHNGHIPFNPLVNTQEKALVSPSSREGNPLSAKITLSGKSDYLRDYPYFVYTTHEDASDRTDAATEFVDTIPVFVGTHADISYQIKPKEDLPYFVYSDVIKVGSDIVTADYRKACELHFRIKDVDGKFMNLADLNADAPFFNLMDASEKDRSKFWHSIQRYSFKETDYDLKENYVRLFALPGSYFFDYWSIPQTVRDYPSGQQGVLIVEDNKVQDWVVDYSYYISFRQETNLDLPSIPDMLFKRKYDGALWNSTLEKARFDNPYILGSYTRVLKDASGRNVTRIWPPVGFETVEFSGNVGTCRYAYEPVALEKGKEYVYNLPDLGVVRYTYPKALNDLGAAISCDSLEVVEAPSKPGIPNFTVDSLYVEETGYVYHEVGEANMSLNLALTDSTAYNQQRQAKVSAGDTVDVSFGLKNAAVFNLPYKVRDTSVDLNVSTDKNFAQKVRSLAEARSEKQCQKFYLFSEEQVDYAVSAKGVLPQTGHLKMADQLQFVTPDWSGYNQLTLFSDTYRSFYSRIKNAIATDKDGRQFDVEFLNDDTSVTVLSLPSRVDFDYSYNFNTFTDNTAVYHYAIDLSEDVSVELEDVRVVFLKDGKQISTGYLDTDNVQKEDIKLYYLSSPFVDEKTALPIHLGRKDKGVFLLAGKYCAEDLEGNKYYFEIEKGSKSVSLDLDNLPTGIEGIEKATSVPAAYYDLSGRRIDAPQKGLNIIRMQNGSVRKVMIK